VSNRSITGIRRARVINTDEFKETGKIKINILGLMTEDAYEYAEILTPFGGLPNMGMQILPPIGAIGYVQFERNQDTLPVWIGSVLRSWGKELYEDKTANPVESEDPSDFIIKTQYTKTDDQEYDGDTNKVENILKMNENEFTLAKVRQDTDDYSYEKESYDIEDKAYNIVKLTDEEIKINFKFKDNSKSNNISVKEDGVSMSFDTDAGEMTTVVTEDTIELTAGKSIITVNKDGDVTIDTEGKVKLNGDSNTAVLYEPLRDFVNQTFNSHTHGSPAGPTSPPTSPYTNTQSMKSKSVEMT